MVESAGLENRNGLRAIEGSNPSPSAQSFQKKARIVLVLQDAIVFAVAFHLLVKASFTAIRPGHSHLFR